MKTIRLAITFSDVDAFNAIGKDTPTTIIIELTESQIDRLNKKGSIIQSITPIEENFKYNNTSK